MYAPYRILPFDHLESPGFEEKTYLHCADIKDSAPLFLFLTFCGVRQEEGIYVRKYTLHFTKDFAAKDDDGNLTNCCGSLFDQELLIPDKNFEFSLPTTVEGVLYQTVGERRAHHLKPPESFEFLEKVYTLESFDAIRDDLFEGVYKS